MVIKKKSGLIIFLSLTFVIYTILFFVESCKNTQTDTSFISKGSNEFIGPEACSSCHYAEYLDWVVSDHFKSMLEANDTTVSGDFNNTVFTSDGVTSRFFKRGDDYFINTEGPDGINHDYQVKYTFGYYPLQQYLVEFPSGRMQVPRVTWDVEGRKWFHQYPGEKIKSNDWLHWTNAAQNWNSMCAICHSTNLKKNYIAETDSFHTTWSVINVSCESCHGPGKNHVDYINSEAYKSGDTTFGSFIAMLKTDTNFIQLNTCAVCHARRTEIKQDFIHSDNLLDNLIPQIPTTESYFADGQIKDENYEYGSFTQSLMFHRGIKCSSCHNAHSGKIIKTGNALCLDCHNSTYNESTHTFHQPKSPGSACINCHMPSKYYMGVDLRRDHSLRIPRPDLSVQYDVPNACNQCHTDKSTKWASDAVIKWFGEERKYHFSEDLIPGSKADANSTAHLQKLINDDSIPFIIRATAIYYLSLTSSPSIDLFKKNMFDEDPIIRYHAIGAIGSFSPQIWAGEAAVLLNDPVRAVRINTANIFSTVSNEVFDRSSNKQYIKANDELLGYMNYQSDFINGNVMLGDYYYKTADYLKAEKYYLRSIEMDSLANYSRINLSTIYNAQKRNDKALAILEKAAEVDPSNARIFYLLALLHYEMGNTTKSENNFIRAIDLNYPVEGVYYNYALFLMQKTDYINAEKILKQGLNLNHDSESLNYCISLVYIKSDRKNLAIPYVKKLKTINPDDPNYAQIYKLFSM